MNVRINIISGNPWLQTATSRPLLTGIAVAMIAAVLIALASRTIFPLRAGMARVIRLRKCADGTATIEFALVFPVLLFLVLILTQTTFLMGANLFVHYAAFAATRAAIVQVPVNDAPDEEPNVVINSTGHAKHDTIRRAAVFAVVPISGRISQSTVNADDFVQGLTQYFNNFPQGVNSPGQSPPAWINNLAGDRLRYADANTLVSLMSTSVASDGHVVFTDLPEQAAYVFGPKDPVTVRVTHRLYLSVPYVGMFFADGKLSGIQGSGRYTLVSAQYTLTNEGVYDALPPTPDLPRTP